MSKQKMFFGDGILRDGWKMLTVAFDGTTPKLYINSIEIALTNSIVVGTYSKITSQFANTPTFRIGSTYIGLIDEVSFHKNRQLSKSDIDFIFNKGRGNVYANWDAALRTNLECYYDFSQTQDLITGITSGIVYFQQAFVTDKYGNALRFNNNTSGNRFASGLMLPTNATTDVPYTFNLWLKPTDIVNCAINSTGNPGDNNARYIMTLNPTSLIITYYSQGSAADYKQFTFNFNSLI